MKLKRVLIDKRVAGKLAQAATGAAVDEAGARRRFDHRARPAKPAARPAASSTAGCGSGTGAR